jgi:hypothetical protein
MEILMDEILRVIQSSAPIRLGIVEGLDVRASRFS